MKALLFIILVAAAVVLVLLFAPTSSTTGNQQQPQQTQTQQTQTQQTQTQQTQTQQTQNAAGASPAQRHGIVDDATEVMSYGVGYTQFKVKQRSDQRLNQIQQQRNQELEREANR